MRRVVTTYLAKDGSGHDTLQLAVRHDLAQLFYEATHDEMTGTPDVFASYMTQEDIRCEIMALLSELPPIVYKQLPDVSVKATPVCPHTETGPYGVRKCGAELLEEL